MPGKTHRSARVFQIIAPISPNFRLLTKASVGDPTSTSCPRLRRKRSVAPGADLSDGTWLRLPAGRGARSEMPVNQARYVDDANREHEIIIHRCGHRA